jgi:hypothetical protein
VYYVRYDRSNGEKRAPEKKTRVGVLSFRRRARKKRSEVKKREIGRERFLY